MNTAAIVDASIEQWIREQKTKTEMVPLIAESCLGWPYVWGGYGQYDTSKNRQSYANRSSCPEGESAVIIKKCQILNGSKSSCAGCQYYPGDKVRFFDCRGFTRWVFQQLGITIYGAGATSQYNTDSNWTEKGEIANMPDVICCVFMKDGKTMSHTGIHVGGGNIIHCSGTVKRGKITDKGWSHYAIPKGMDGTVPEDKPTLRIGSTGPYVVECQNDLIQLGYDLSPYGADGKYGKTTSARVKDFQSTHTDQNGNNLVADGICGSKTWWALDNAIDPPAPGPQPTTLYTVIVPHLTEEQANALQAQYPDAEKRKEG